MNPIQEDVLLQLIMPQRQKEPVLDFLLSRPEKRFFTVIQASGFGQPQEVLSTGEQVAGAQDKVKIEIEIAHADVHGLLQNLELALPTLTLFYRVLPILEQGELNPDRRG